MKTLTIVSVILILISSSLLGQKYFPFPYNNVYWNVYLVSGCDQDSPPDTMLLRYTIHGDTIINEIAYHKLCLAKGDTVNPTLEPIGGLREESKRVYYIGNTILGLHTEQEFLLYDFTDEINDTIEHSSDGVFSSIILDIDSILIGDQYRKRYKVNNGWRYHNPDYIIEGIGSVVNGLLGHISDIPTCGTHYWEHVCFNENGQVVYQNPTFTDCYAGVNLSSLELIVEKKIKIYPNPFTESVQIYRPPGDKSLSVWIFNSAGKLICENEITEMNCSILIPGPAGIYIAIIKDENGMVFWEEKIIKD